MSDHLILVTGASGGIGKGIVQDLLQHGHANVVCQYRMRPGTLFDMFPQDRLFQANLTSEDQVYDMQSEIKARFGDVTHLINVVGSSTNSMSWKTSIADFKRVMDDNLMTTFLTCRQFIPGMRAQQTGRIINTSSIVAETGVAGAAHYCAAKAAIVGYTKSIALELAPKGITANVLGLGYFDSGIISQLTQEQQDAVVARTPAKRLGTAADVGGVVRYLLSDEASFVTGQVMHVNGGLYL